MATHYNTRIIKEEGFRLNANKTRVAYKHQRQEVTGLLVNDNHIHISKKYIKKMKQEIYYCKKYGVDNHLLHENINKRFYKEHLYGKAYYVKMINEQLGIELLKELDQINWDGRYGNGEIE